MDLIPKHLLQSSNVARGGRRTCLLRDEKTYNINPPVNKVKLSGLDYKPRSHHAIKSARDCIDDFFIKLKKTTMKIYCHRRKIPTIT